MGSLEWRSKRVMDDERDDDDNDELASAKRGGTETD